LGRVTEHRMAMLRNQATALLRYEHLTTTVPRAKELRPFVERLITIAKRGVAGSRKSPSQGAASAAGAANGHLLTARRLVMHDLQDREVVGKLFDTIAPRFASRPGGYTRLLRVGYRRGDSAEIALVELIGSEFNPRAKADTEAAPKESAPKAKGVGGRLRAAADRLRGKKDDAGVRTKEAPGASSDEPLEGEAVEGVEKVAKAGRGAKSAKAAKGTKRGAASGKTKGKSKT
jgi:large subunit ribosomal protein L17